MTMMKTQSRVDEEAELSGSQMPDRSSSSLRATPHLTARGLTILLCLMCFVPVVTIFSLWQLMPPVHEGQLEASVSAVDLPPPEFYESKYADRPDWALGELVVKNNSDQDWTHLNIQINRHYQIYDIEPIPARGVRKYKLSRFVSRSGARFQVRYNTLKSVRIYARRPTRDRATFYYEFEGSNQ